MSTDQLAVDPSGGLDALLGHPLATRTARLGQRVREFDAAHPWALDTAVVVALVVVFCLPDLLHRDIPRDVAVKFTRVPVAATVTLHGRTGCCRCGGGGGRRRWSSTSSPRC